MVVIGFALVGWFAIVGCFAGLCTIASRGDEAVSRDPPERARSIGSPARDDELALPRFATWGDNVIPLR